MIKRLILVLGFIPLIIVCFICTLFIGLPVYLATGEDIIAELFILEIPDAFITWANRETS